MTDEELKELVASLAVAQQKTDETLRSVGIQLGNMSRNQGDVAEEFFFNSLANDTHLGAIHFDDIAKNEHKRRGKTEEEYDIVMTNGNAIGIVEVKYKAHINDLEKLERKMKNFKTLFPWFENYKLYGAMASFHINDDAKREALNRGFFVLQRSGSYGCSGKFASVVTKSPVFGWGFFVGGVVGFASNKKRNSNMIPICQHSCRIL